MVLELEEKKVGTAVSALIKLSENSTKKLIDEVEVVNIQVCLKRVPPKEKSIKLQLPHGLAHEGREICLFVKDLDGGADREYQPSVSHFQDLLQKSGIDKPADIIPLKQLKLEYKPYEAKRNLSNAFDIYLADARIMRLLPSYLGKHFYGKKKSPVQVDFEAKDLKEEFQAAVNNSRCVISSKGDSSLGIVANLGMTPAEVTANICAAANQVAAAVPGGPTNVKTLAIKTPCSPSIPLYQAAGGPQDVKIAKKDQKEVVEAEEISTLLGAKVKVFPNGDIKVIKDGETDDDGPKRKRRRMKKKTKRSKKASSSAADSKSNDDSKTSSDKNTELSSEKKVKVAPKAAKKSKTEAKLIADKAKSSIKVKTPEPVNARKRKRDSST